MFLPLCLVPALNQGRRSDWTLDVTQPNADAEYGWQYANSFESPDEEWIADQPPQLQRLMTGAGAVAVGLSGQSSSRPSGSRSTSVAAQSWVRRRRWVRVMRRRLDIPPLPFLQPDGKMYHFSADGHLVPYMEASTNEDVEDAGQELSTMPSTGLSSAQDYVARARYHADSSTESPAEPTSAVEARRAIAKLERATTELRQGTLSAQSIYSGLPGRLTDIAITDDEDAKRKTQAEVLLNVYSRELERRRLVAGAQGLLISGNGGFCCCGPTLNIVGGKLIMRRRRGGGLRFRVRGLLPLRWCRSNRVRPIHELPTLAKRGLFHSIAGF